MKDKVIACELCGHIVMDNNKKLCEYCTVDKTIIKDNHKQIWPIKYKIPIDGKKPFVHYNSMVNGRTILTGGNNEADRY